MKTKLDWLENIFLLVPFLLLVALWQRIPERIAIHWNLNGQVDGWGEKGWSLPLLPLASIAIVLILRIVPRFDPKLREESIPSERMRTALQSLRFALVLFFFVIFLLILAASLGFAFSLNRILLNSVLLLFAIVGNYLGVLRPNYFVGLRTPWTLENPATWRATHRLGGKLMCFGSLALLLLQFVISEHLIFSLLIFATLLFVAWAFVYSWHHFRTCAATARHS